MLQRLAVCPASEGTGTKPIITLCSITPLTLNERHVLERLHLPTDRPKNRSSDLRSFAKQRLPKRQGQQDGSLRP